jgi:predicted PurR-regulated permease PerM
MDHPHARAYFLAIVTTLLAVLTVYMLRPFLVTVGLAAVFAVVFMPVYGRFKRAKLSDSLASLMTILVGLVLVALPLTFLSTQLFQEAQNVYVAVAQPGGFAQAQGALGSVGDYLDARIPGAGVYFDSLSENLSTYVRNALSWGLGQAGAFFSGTLAFLLQFFVFLMTLYYLLKESSRLRLAIARFSPLSKVETATLTARVDRTIASVVRGTLVIAIIQGALTAVGFYLFGIPNPVLWGTVAIIGALIPSVGTALVFIPAVLYLLFIGSTGAGIGLGLFGLLFVGLTDNILRPILVGGRASIHPLLILLSVLGGLALFGPAGLFLGPLVISLLLGLLSLTTPPHEEPI